MISLLVSKSSSKKSDFIHNSQVLPIKPFNRISYEARKMDWNVDFQAIVTSLESIKYFAPYLFKVESNLILSKLPENNFPNL